MADAHELLTSAIGPNRLETNRVYNGWADNYERDMREVKYFGPATLMEHFDKLGVGKDWKILDLCAGTGALGRELARRGHRNLHAVDGAEEMLARARQEANYLSYQQLLFQPDSRLPFDDNSFDCVLMAGVFAPGHLPIVALHEVCRVTRKGGVVAWICCDPKHYEDKDPQYAGGAFPRLLEELRARGVWRERPGFPVPVPYIEYSDGFVMAFELL